ncbi:hypothetical protein Y032_0010g1062 [Ancylostoma ceylanicum]|uniref:Uncharacterized protein n=1 Tax=Ancylostoma ceylanicum TaxID=53326 RepID=A0A016VF65_9BILA|nr:hypothetical protein Y032_0010g1062 [Ancylostoma ceylanicum]
MQDATNVGDRFAASPAEFVPSKCREHDVAVYHLPSKTELCYEWCFKKVLSDQQTKTYICCGCKSMKDRDCSRYDEPIPSCRIKDGYFITNLAFPFRRHYCEAKSLLRTTMRRTIIKKSNELRSLPSRQLVTEVIHDLAEEGSHERFGKSISSSSALLLFYGVQTSDALSSASEQMMVEQLSSSNKKE